jgi:hypothetical protein
LLQACNDAVDRPPLLLLPLLLPPCRSPPSAPSSFAPEHLPSPATQLSSSSKPAQQPQRRPFHTSHGKHLPWFFPFGSAPPPPRCQQRTQSGSIARPCPCCGSLQQNRQVSANHSRQRARYPRDGPLQVRPLRRGDVRKHGDSEPHAVMQRARNCITGVFIYPASYSCGCLSQRLTRLACTDTTLYRPLGTKPSW